MFNYNGSIYYSDSDKRNSTRVLCVLSALLFLLFSIVDLWALSSSVYEALIIRGLVIASLGITFTLTYASFFSKYHDYIVLATFFVASVSIEYMIYIAQPSDYAFSTYFVGLLLVYMTLFSWTYIGVIKSLVVAFASIGIYIYIEAYTRDASVSSSYEVIATNVFFIVGALVIGFVARVMRDSFLRENHLLQQSLKEAVKEKTIEAEDNAYIANHDSLTKLPNRRYITELLEESLQLAKEREKVLAILFLDLNGFKQVNDVYGHAVGDTVLIIVARRLELAVRQGDNISRLGGDEYLVSLMMERENINDIEKMAVKFTEVISRPMNIDGLRIKVGVSIGIAAYPMHGNKVSVLLDIADKKMYKVKQGKESTHLDNDHTASEAEPIVFFPENRKLKKIK